MPNNNFFRNKITIVNAIMCVLVVFLHSHNIDKYGNSAGIGNISLLESFISKSLGNLAVPTFFFMSSILFFHNYDLSKIWSKYKSRVFSLMIPFFLWNFLYMIFFFILINTPLSNAFMDTKEFTVNVRILVDSIFFYRYHGSYWFIYQLILFISISPMIYVVMKSSYKIPAVPGLLIISYWLPKIPNIPYGISIVYLIYWLLGAYYAMHMRDRIYHRSSKKKIYLTLSLSIVLVLVRFYLEFVNPELKVSEYVLNLLLFINVITVWFALDILKLNIVYGWMKMSFFIYSIHPLIVDMIKKAIFTLFPQNTALALSNYIISGIGGILISVCIAKIMIRFSPKTYNILCGGRSA